MQIKLLGQARAFQNGVWQPIPMDKRGALLVYLAFYGDWLTRDELAFTFWPDTDTSTAKANLRQILRRSKLLPLARALESDTKRIRWQVETDLQAFHATVNQGAWIKAVESYGGHLLEQFVIPEAEGFMAWLELERSELQQNWQQAVQAASEALAQTDRHKEAADLIKRVWKLDAFDEEVLRSYMRQAHLAGQKQAALKVYESFKSLLDQDMQLEPLEETTVPSPREVGNMQCIP